MFNIEFADDFIRTVDLWNPKRPLCQLVTKNLTVPWLFPYFQPFLYSIQIADDWIRTPVLALSYRQPFCQVYCNIVSTLPAIMWALSITLVHCCTYMLYLHVVPTCCTYMLYPHVEPTCCTYMLNLHVVPTCCTYMLYLHVEPTFCTYILYLHVVPTFCTFMVGRYTDRPR